MPRTPKSVESGYGSGFRRYLPYINAAARIGRAAYSGYRQAERITRIPRQVAAAARKLDFSQFTPKRGPGFTPKPARRARRGAKKSGLSGFHVPSVRRFPKAKKSVIPLFKARQQGFVHISENTGSASDPNCLYLMVGSSAANTQLEQLCHALLRKLFYKGAIDIPDIRTLILGRTVGGTDASWRLTYYYFDTELQTGGNITHDIVATDSIFTLIGEETSGTGPGWATLMNDLFVFVNYSTGSTRLPVALQLSQFDLSAPSHLWTRSELILNQEYVHYESILEIKIQNRSLSASASGDTTNVSANPLIGRKYIFKGGCPVPKTIRGLGGFNDNSSIFCQADNLTGIVQIDAASLSQDLKEPPSPQFFNNCSKWTGVKMAPGGILTDRLVYRSSSNFVVYLQNLKSSGSSNNTGYKKKGSCWMLALEDLINVNSDSEIELAYEIQRTCGVYLTSKRLRASATYFKQNTV